MFEQATLPVQDEKTFAEVTQALNEAFSARKVEDFLHRIKRAGLRARDFEGVLSKGLLGKEVPAQYGLWGTATRARSGRSILWLVEQVAPELRARFLKVYAYY